MKKKKKNNNYLKFAGIIEIILGVASIILISYFLLKEHENSPTFLYRIRHNTFAIFNIYFLHVIQIFAGIVGVVYSKIKTNKGTLKILGIALIIIHILSLIEFPVGVIEYIIAISLFIIPAYYIYGAGLSRKR